MIHLPRLTLSQSRPSDAPDFRALEADPEVMRFLTGGQTGQPSDGTWAQPQGTEPEVWTARLHDGSFVGWFGLWPEEDGSAEMGYRLARAHWGQGLAAEGARALMDWGFSQGHRAITASTLTVNLASRRVMEKIGMTHLRTTFPAWPTPFPGTEAGEVWYQALRPEN
ncbi:GNAT family N-acetyltransferase [Stagnihabitans tardus]|uniref:GNAT family N-acetyltransferase n=1 Tax=Stagnihabitans tardus TaxID=2699202 RepID=A0AAE4Y7G8_9RHOB|nr:GNAT family N-acetyltransferase [Stagnihabitans tardus]NBZ87297.1 GNAT family N-acetyltransferase [Stagnihabitans tardus]